MNDQISGADLIALDQVTFRKALGMLGMSFPFILLIGGLLFDGRIGTSISAYYHFVAPPDAYHPAMRDVFVGVLFLIGLSLIFYQGYEKKIDEPFSDNLIANVAGISAIAVALIPTDDTEGISVDIIGDIHLAFATVFFVALTYICWSVFTRTDKREKTSVEKKRKKKSNQIYRICARIMATALVLIAVVSIWLPDLQDDYYAVFVLESIAVFFFGLAWWIKADTSLWTLLKMGLKKDSAAPE